MDMIKPELHVVQQIRSDKCRVEQINDLPNNWDHHQKNIRIPNNLGLFGISHNQISVPVQTNAYQDCTTTFMNNQQGSSNWRSIDLSQPSSVNCYGYDHDGIRPSNVGDVFSNHLNIRNQTLDHPLYVGRDTIAQSSLTSRSEVSCLEDNQKSRVTVACSGTANELLKSSYYEGSSSGSYRGEFVFLPSLGNQLRDGGNATVMSTMSPLGPFTGYASILKSSRFLEPAQKMLEEFCISYASKIVSGSESSSMDNDDSSAMLSSTNRAVDGFSSSSEPLEPKNRLKRAKLLFLQEEVCETIFLFSYVYYIIY